MTKPGNAPQQVASTHDLARTHSLARRPACSPKPIAREMRDTPRIQLRKPCISILAPLPCGVQAGNGHPARDFPPIKGLAKLEIAVQALTRGVLSP